MAREICFTRMVIRHGDANQAVRLFCFAQPSRSAFNGQVLRTEPEFAARFISYLLERNSWVRGTAADKPTVGARTGCSATAHAQGLYVQ